MIDTKKVLVIDDEYFVCKSITKILALESVQTDIAMSGREGIVKARAENYDLIFVDVKMPEMNGYSVVKFIREIQPDLPVVVISGYNCEHTAEQAALCGSLDFIPKPFTPDELMTVAMKYLSGPRKNIVAKKPVERRMERAESSSPEIPRRNPLIAIGYSCNMPDFPEADLYFSAQKKGIAEFCKKNNLELRAIYEDATDRDAISERPAIRRILETEKEAGRFVVDSVCYLSQRRKDLRAFLEILDRENIKLETASFLMDINSQFARRWYYDKNQDNTTTFKSGDDDEVNEEHEVNEENEINGNTLAN